MPVFEYKCNDCGNVSEFLEKNGKSQKHKCSKCGGSNMKKVLSGFAVGQSKSAPSPCETCFNAPCQAECEGMDCGM